MQEDSSPLNEAQRNKVRVDETDSHFNESALSHENSTHIIGTANRFYPLDDC